jgi:hypothetical protein
MNPNEVIPAGAQPPANVAPPPALPPDVSNRTWFRGVPPEDKLNRMFGFAKAICNAAFISPVVRGDEASVFYLISMAEDLGAQWTHGLRSIYPLVKKGRDGEGDQIRAGIQGDLAMALLLGRGFKVKIKESTDQICTVWMARPNGDMEFEDSFTIAEANDMGLTGKPNWKYKKDMLRWRSIMRVARIVAADILGGMYLREELEDEFGVSERSERERGDSSDAAFQAEARRQTEAENPYKVGRKTAEAKQEPSEAPKPTETTEKAAEAVKTAGPSLDKPKEETKPEPAKAAPSAPPEARKPVMEDQPSLFQGQDPSATVDPSATAVKTEAPKPELVKPAEKPKDGKKTINEILAEMTELLPTVSPETLKRKTFPEFLRGFTNISDLKKCKREQAEPAVAILPHLIRDYKSQFLSDPHGAGVLAGAGFNKLQRYFTAKWPSDCVDLAMSIAIERYSDSGGADLIDYLTDPVAIDSMNPGEMRAFLAVLAKTRSAIILRDIADKFKVPMVDVYMAMELDLNVATTAEVEARLKQLLAEGIGGTAPAAADEDDGLSFFDEIA